MPYPYHEDLIRGTMKRIPEMAKLNRRFRKLTWAFILTDSRVVKTSVDLQLKIA